MGIEVDEGEEFAMVVVMVVVVFWISTGEVVGCLAEEAKGGRQASWWRLIAIVLNSLHVAIFIGVMI